MIRGNHVEPLMRWTQRSVMWRLGYGEKIFKEMYGGQAVAEEPVVQPIPELQPDNEEGDWNPANIQI